MQVLLIEDEILVQKSLARLLEKKGAQVTACSTGVEAVSRLSKNKFDRVVCDLMLHDITGFDIIEESKKYYALSEIPKIFVIMTAYSSDQVINKAKEYGCPILNKPFEDMHSAINLILKTPTQ